MAATIFRLGAAIARRRGFVPLGGPGGYTSLLYSDSFGTLGASKAAPGGPANYTSVAQLNTNQSNVLPYGLNGTAWDLYWAGSTTNNVTMNTDWVEIRPNNGTPSQWAWMVSHFLLPIATTSLSVYIEVRLATGRGEGGAFDGVKCWPAFWSYPGNEPSHTSNVSELDWLETYQDQQYCGTVQSGSAWVDSFFTSQHIVGAPTVDLCTSFGSDITTNMNVFGYEWTHNSGGGETIKVYFNGSLKNTLVTTGNYTNTPPAMFLGYNAGSTTQSNAVQKIDYIRVWKK